ncbi:MAG: ABC transporter permease [Acidobacteria bacterium]|nr:ABC transporter permease [Acidobacteriota bacterium]
MAFLQDLRYAVRMLAKDPGFTAVAVLALALGIGMNTTVFTFVNAVLIRGLPFEDSHQLLHVDVLNTSTSDDSPASWPEFEEWKTRTKTFSDLAGFRSASMNITETSRPPERASGALVTPNMFGLLRQPVFLGRDFREEDGRKNGEPVVLIGHALWKNRYGSDRSVIGQSIKVNEVACTIIGVMPEGMRFPQNHDIWRPLVPDAALEKRDNRGIRIVGRLAPGITKAQAQIELSGFAKQLQSQYPDTNKDIDAQILTFNQRFNGGEIRIVFLALLGAVGFVLLIACANVANLLLARSAKRAREIAIRFALGASRTRVVRQLLVESTLLAFIGGSLGLFLSYAGIRAFDAAVADSGKPYWIVFSMDFTVFGYMAAICLATGIIFGMAPALQVSKTNVNEILKEGGRGAAGGPRARRMRSALVITELALTVVLLIGAGLMVRSFLKLYSLDLGVDSDHLLTMRADLPVKYATPEQRRQAFDTIISRISATPGVRAAALADSIPMGGGSRFDLEIEGKPTPPGTAAPQAMAIAVTSDYFKTVDMSLLRGRAFDANDGAPGAESIVVNERFVTRFFPAEDPIGRRVKLVVPQNRDTTTPPQPWRTIVGVSQTVRQGDPQALEPDAVLYRPYRQNPFSSMTILVRTEGEPSALTAQVRRAVQSADPDQAVFNVRSLNEVLANVRWPFRVFGSMFAIFALVALALSAVGIYAVTSYAVTQRTAEIGVRMALGAQPQQVWWLILRQGMFQLAIGLGLGLAAGVGLAGILKSLVVQIPFRDPVTFTVTAALLALVMLAACLIPARRATQLDPLAALRVE